MTVSIDKIQNVAYHRNGISGEPFVVVTFTSEGRNMVGILFENDPPLIEGGFVNPRTAVLDVELLAQGKIGMGENSWRGDNYDPMLRDAARAADKEI